VWGPYELDGRKMGLLTESVEEVSDPDGSERTSWSQFV